MVEVSFRIALGLRAAVATCVGVLLVGTAVATPPSKPAASKPQMAKHQSARKGLPVVQTKGPPEAKLDALPPIALVLGCVPGSRLPVALSHGSSAWSIAGPTRIAFSAPRPGDGACVNYAMALAPTGETSSVAVLERRQDADRPVVSVYSRFAPDAPVSESALDLAAIAARQRELELPAQSLETMDPQELETVPANLRWQLALLIQRMGDRFAMGPAHRLRVVLNQRELGQEELLQAVELVEVESGRPLESVLWLDRAHEPGAFFSTSGEEYERTLWLSPTKQVRISRGVGEGVAKVKRRVAVAAPGKRTPRMVTRTFLVRGHHIGIDFAAPIGTPVYAVANADVVFAGAKGGYGNLIVLSHGGDYQTYYAHLSGFDSELAVGKHVARGEVIGYVGSTGWSTGPHLHFEVRKDGLYIDPLNTSNRLPIWGLKPEEQSKLLTQLLVLDATRSKAALAATYSAASKNDVEAITVETSSM